MPEIPGYRLERKLGEGGMGRVFLARVLAKNDSSPQPEPRSGAPRSAIPQRGEGEEKMVAIKTMLPKKSVVAEADVLRFQREMATCARLQHPNIVAFIDQGFHNGVLYFVMEYCKEGSVNDLLVKSGGRLTTEVSLEILRQVLDGLSYAHKHGIVHRDLKPSNILLHSGEESRTAMIADFGLAKNFQQAGLSGMTMSGMYSGTLPFMPPEQIINFRDVKPVSDIFAAGATLYMMLTGEPVYDFAGAEEPIRAILEMKTVPILARGVKLPAKLAEVVDRAVAPEADKRFQTALEMKTALREAI
jgi:eukaryotic-like serine/threonine-protein kinase